MRQMDLDEKRRELGQRIRQARQTAGLTQSQLAERAQLDQGHLARIERGAKWPSLEALYRLAEALDVPVFRLVEESPDDRDHYRQTLLDSLSGCSGEQVRFVTQVVKLVKEEWPRC